MDASMCGHAPLGSYKILQVMVIIPHEAFFLRRIFEGAWSKSILGKSSRTPGLASSYLLRPYRWKAETRGRPRWYILAK